MCFKIFRWKERRGRYLCISFYFLLVKDYFFRFLFFGILVWVCERYVVFLSILYYSVRGDLEYKIEGM